MQLTGHLIEVFKDEKSNKEKHFVVIDTTIDDRYPKCVAVAFFGRSLDYLKNLNLQRDEMVTVEYEPESRKYNERYLTELRGFKVRRGRE